LRVDDCSCGAASDERGRYCSVVWRMVCCVRFVGLPVMGLRWFAGDTSLFVYAASGFPTTWWMACSMLPES
jgi:hypothetical protein